jgi:hypothetical protein
MWWSGRERRRKKTSGWEAGEGSNLKTQTDFKSHFRNYLAVCSGTDFDGKTGGISEIEEIKPRQNVFRETKRIAFIPLQLPHLPDLHPRMVAPSNG